MCLLERLGKLQNCTIDQDLVVQLEQLILDAQMLKNDDVYLTALIFLGDVHVQLSEVEKAIKQYKSALGFCANSNDVKLTLINKMIPLVKMQGLNVNLYQLLKDKESLLLEAGQIDYTLYIELAQVHYHLKDYDKSLDYYKKVLDYDLSSEVQTQIYSQLAKVCIAKKEFDLACNFLDDANEIVYQIKDYYGLVSNKHLKAKILLEQGKEAEAKTLLLETINDLELLTTKKTILPVMTLLDLLVKDEEYILAKTIVSKYGSTIEKDTNVGIRKRFFELCTKVYNDNTEVKLDYTNKLLSTLEQISIDNKRLEDSLLQKIDDFEKSKQTGQNLFSLILNIDKIVEFIGSLDNQLSFRDMFMKINEYLSEFISFDDSTIIRIKQYDETFKFYHYKMGRVYDRVKTRNELDETIFNKMFTTKKELIINNNEPIYELEPFSHKTYHESGITSIVAYPLLSPTQTGNELIGMLAFYLKNGKTFSEESTLALLKIVSHLYTAKLINAEYSHNVSNLKDVYEVALSNTDTGVIYSKNFIQFEISNHLYNVLGIEGIVSYDVLLYAFVEEDKKKLDAVLQSVQSNNYQINQHSLDLATKYGKWVKLEMNIKTIEGAFAFISMKVSDITKTKGQIETYTSLAFYDKLTQLRNRASLNNKLSELKQKDNKFSVLMMDLNGFKQINDTFGHETGDNVLICVAGCLKKVFKEEEGCYPFRQSGDEFVVIIEDCISKSTINSLINEYIKELKKGYTKDLVTNIPLASSIGVARYPTDVKNKDKIVNYADYAMYAVKSRKNIIPDYYFKYFEKQDLEKEQSLDPKKVMGLEEENV